MILRDYWRPPVVFYSPLVQAKVPVAIVPLLCVKNLHLEDEQQTDENSRRGNTQTLLPVEGESLTKSASINKHVTTTLVQQQHPEKQNCQLPSWTTTGKS
jgi:hypothetical protein